MTKVLKGNRKEEFREDLELLQSFFYYDEGQMYLKLLQEEFYV